MLRWILLGLGVAVLVLFILANPQAVALRLWPGGWQVEGAAWVVAIAAATLGFVIGAAIVWLAHLPEKRRLADLERAARLLDAEYEERREAGRGGRGPSVPALT
ncbi:MAG: lipopolysaccharide assembly protein LapA domain-containing protein [Acetobacteraceae bacterium]|nr:lipopolysaccharide assembly protein LapA domain-containing protein [Acetobacteraceae bacterium]